MSDLIEELKYYSGWVSRNVPGIQLSPASKLCWDAIDEIESLRSQLAEARKALEECRRARDEYDTAQSELPAHG